jgi:hypothetical protein
VLEPLVQIERAVEQATAGAPRAVALQRLARRGEYLRMMGEPQIVVGAHHDPLFAFDDDDGVFRVGNGPEVRVQAHGLQLSSLGERLALIEQCDVLQGLGVHGAPRAVIGKMQPTC